MSPSVRGSGHERPARMPYYESTFIARQDVPSQQVESLAQKFADIIAENGGSVTKTEYWGLRNLAYKIKKNRKGHYVLFNIEASPAAMHELERNLRIHEDVLRYLTVRVEALDPNPSVIMQSRAAREERSRRESAGTSGEARGAGESKPQEAKGKAKAAKAKDKPMEAKAETGGTKTKAEEAKGKAREAKGKAGEAKGKAGKAKGKAGEAKGKAGKAKGKAEKAKGKAEKAEGKAGETQAKGGGTKGKE